MQTRWEQGRSQSVAVCKECGEDIWPADEILIVHEREVRFPYPARIAKQIYCKGCGELYIESQELGSDA